MEETATYTQFIDQPVSNLNSKEILDLAKKNLKIFGEIEQKQFKRLESQLKYEKKVDDKEKEKRVIDERRQKELDELKEKNYQEEFNRAKEQKENFEKLKSFSISDVIPSRIQEMGMNRSQQTEDNSNKRLFERITSTLELIPEKIQKTVRKPQDQKGEQQNLSEDILRVSFHKEGIQILKTLLDPIYKALQANTEQLDKMLKKITEGEKGSGLGWLALLAGAIFVLIEEVYKKIKRLGELFEIAKTKVFTWIDEVLTWPEKIKKAFQNSRLGKFLEEKWSSIIESIKDLGRYTKAYWDEFVVTPFKEKWNSFMTRAKNIISFDELKVAFETRWTTFIDKAKKFFNFDDFMKRVEGAGKGVSGFWDSIKSGWKSFGDTISAGWEKVKVPIDAVKSWFSEEGWMGKIISKVKIAFEGLSTAFENVLKFLDPVWNSLRQAGSFMKPILKVLGWVLVLLDPIIAAGKTLFNIWNNENLSFFEKSIAVLTSAFFGLGDGIAALINIISQGVAGIWNLITGKGWVTDNPVSNFFGGMTKDNSFGGMGETMGEHATLAMEDSAEDLAINKPDYDPYDTPKYKKLKELEEGGLTPEEEDYLQTKFDDQGQPVDDLVMSPKGISPLILDRTNNQLYQTAPNDELLATRKGGILEQSLTDLKSVMTDMAKNMLNANINKNQQEQPSMIVNNTNVSGGGKESKEYLFKPMFDVNADKRASWWMMSREYNTGT